MTEYRSNTTHADLAQRMCSAERMLITTHVKPDGDAMGSCLALWRALTAKRKRPDILLMGPIEPNLLQIAGATPVMHRPHTDSGSQMDPGPYDLIIVTDTGAWSQLEPVESYLRHNHERVIGIDHHTRGDDVAAWRIIEPGAVSTTAILFDLLQQMQCEITGGVGGIAEALFVGLATDSGWFRYNNAGPDAFALAARLLNYGVDKARLYQMLEENFGPQRLALEARALASLEYLPLNSAGGGSKAQLMALSQPLHPTDLRDRTTTGPLAAIQSLRTEDFKAAGASLEDVTGLVNTPMSVGAVRVSVLLTQTSPGLTKISFRSKGPPAGGAADDFVDVNVLANTFGGGGHVHAAGARIKMDLDAAKAIVIERLLATT